MKIRKFGSLAALVASAFLACGPGPEPNTDGGVDACADAGYVDAGSKPDASDNYDAGTPDSGCDAGYIDGGSQVKAILKYSLVANNPTEEDYLYNPREITIAKNQHIFLNFCNSIIDERVAGYRLTDETGRNLNHRLNDCKDMVIDFSNTGVYHPTIQPITESLENIGNSDSLKVNVQ